MDPRVTRQERCDLWPDIAPIDSELVRIYNAVRQTGLPNLHARIPLSSALKIPNWRAMATGHPHDSWLIDMLSFGFPLQYTGPPLAKRLTKNHSSADKFPDHVNEYICKETSELAMVGPFPTHPFPDWSYTNPLMSRPKANTTKRRIIVDLSYPEGSGINSFVTKNHIFGVEIQHTLPAVEQALDIAKLFDFDVYVGIVDIERAYRNFGTDPLDWPLSVIEVQQNFYLDVALPFGARLSSLYMQ